MRQHYKYRLYYKYEETVSRSLLAAIDHNHHLHQAQAKDKVGKPIFSRRWSKRAKRWKIVIAKEKKDYSYFPILCANVLQAAQQKIRTPLEYKHDPQRVAPTIASLPAPATAQLVQEHLSRF